MYSLFGAAFAPSYSAAKGALVQLTKSMAIELAPFNIQVNALAPGWIETDLTEFVKTIPLYQEVITRTPAGRWGNPDELAGTAVFFGITSFRFCHRYNRCRRWQLRHPMNAAVILQISGRRQRGTKC